MKYVKEKIKGSRLNPKNWGVSDYTDKGDFDSAYSSARKEGEKEFMWNNKRYSTDIPNSNMINKYIANNIYPYGYWSTPKSKFKIDYDELMNLKYYNNGIYTTDKKLHIDDIKKITRNEKGESAYDLYRSKGKSSSPGHPKDLDASYDALSIFNNQPQKHNSFIESKYKPSDSKNPNMKYYSFNDKYSKQIEDDLFLYDNRGFINDKENKRQVTGSIIAGASLKDYQYSKGKDDRGDYIAYYDINDYGNILDVIPNTNPFEIYGRIYYKDYNGQNKRMYYSDKELSELDVNKKNFDTLALQRELSNRGYKLPKSTKSDGTFDGIWGDEIKNALLDYQINNYAEGGKLNNHTNINMKFNKEKTKKFQQGGKTPREIMEEARRNQALEREAQRVDRAMQADPAREQAVATANIAAPRYLNTPTVNIPQISNRFNAEIKTSNQTFDQAFAAAIKAGLKEFIWNGERYTTDLASTPQTKRTNTSTANTSTANTPVVNNSTDNTTYDGGDLSELVVTALASAPATDPNKSSIPQSALQSTIARSRNPHFMERGLFGWAWDNLRRIDQENRAAQREAKRIWDEKYAKHQQGGQLHLRNIWERILGITPDYTPVNSQESITSYIDNTLRGPVEKRVIRKEVPYANLHSIMSIRNPGTNRADTTFTAPSGTKYNMNDVRSGKAPSGYSYKFFEKPVGYFQQGGTIENEESGSTDQLYVDFAIRYLKAKGISEDDMIDDEGGLRDEFVEEVTTAINEVDSPDFWEQYQSNPDAVIQSYIESKMEPEQIAMARKGAKLKKLKKLKKGGIKSRKCKCGCDLIMKKEAGGTIVEVCACGCKK